MRITRSRIVAVALMTAAIVVWVFVGVSKHHASPAEQPTVRPRRAAAGPAAGTVTISGAVIDQITHAPVGGVKVVFQGAIGESTTTAGADGNYSIAIARGTYRAFVRDDNVLSIGAQDRVRLPVGPRAETAGKPDEALMPVVIANADAAHVELGVVHAGTITGHVVDRLDKPVAHAIVRARNREGAARSPAFADSFQTRPVLGSDIAETDTAGNFELRVPAGHYAVDASHPDFAGVVVAAPVDVDPGVRVATQVMLTAGCIITGRVVRSDGIAGSDGAIERQFGDLDRELGPSGRVSADGTFRWATTEDMDVTLRAWPWKSPPSQFRKFECHDGARFRDVVLTLPDRHPELTGTVVDATGTPVAFTYVDLQPLDLGGMGQQERTDADGRLEVYDMPAGRYHVEVQAPGRGILSTTIVVPGDNVRLQLGGGGRIAGTTTDLVDGSFEIAFHACAGMATIAHEPKLVVVRGGRFTIDDAPACELELSATWRGASTIVPMIVSANDTTYVEIAIGPPRAKRVHGRVTDPEARPVDGAMVRAVTSDGADDVVVTRTDSAGRYALDAFSGARLRASDSERRGNAMVGRANVPDEEVDIVVDRD